MTTVLATGFGVGLNLLLTPAELEAWGWRIPFVFGLLVGPAGYYIRARLRETPAFDALQTEKAPVRSHRRSRHPDRAVRRCDRGVLDHDLHGAVHAYLRGQAARTGAIDRVSRRPARRHHPDFSHSCGRTVSAAPRSRWPRQSAILLLIYPLFAWLVAVPQLTTLLMVQGILGVLNALNFGCLGG